MTCALRVEMVEEKGFSEEENAREGLSTNERDDWFLNFREVLGLQKKNSACFRSALALTALASEKANKENCSLTQHHLNHFSTSSSLHGPGTRSRARPRTRPLREGPQRRRRDEQQRRRCRRRPRCDVLDLVSSSLVFFKSALSNALSKEDFFSNEMPIDGEAVLALY